MKIYFVAIFAVLLASCGTETKNPGYPRAIRKNLKVRYLTHHGRWQGPDGFPVTGHSLEVQPTKGVELVDDYKLKNEWHRPWNVFLAVAEDKTTFAVKYYNQVDYYAEGRGSTITNYQENRRIADLWFVDESLVILWNDVADVFSIGAWGHGVDTIRVGIDIWKPGSNSLSTTLDIPCEKSYPFLQHTVGNSFSIFNPVCKDNRLVCINDGKTVSLYDIDGEKIKVIHEVAGEIWKCIVDDDKLLLEDRVHSDNRLIARHKKEYNISEL